MSDEKRRFTRFSFDKKIELTTEDGQRILALVNNLSLKGAAITLEDDVELDKNSAFSFKMHFMEDEDIVIEGDALVVEANGNRYSIQFIGVGQSYFDHLKRLLELNYSEE